MSGRFETFTVLINQINRIIRQVKNQGMLEYGLRSIHVSCLYYIYNDEGTTATDLCEHCEAHKANISRALAYLEEEGFLVSRKIGKRYKEPLILTEKGKEAGRKINERIESALDSVSSELTEDARQSLYESLRKIKNGLEALLKENSEQR